MHLTVWNQLGVFYSDFFFFSGGICVFLHLAGFGSNDHFFSQIRLKSKQMKHTDKESIPIAFSPLMYHAYIDSTNVLCLDRLFRLSSQDSYLNFCSLYFLSMYLLLIIITWAIMTLHKATGRKQNMNLGSRPHFHDPDLPHNIRQLVKSHVTLCVLTFKLEWTVWPSWNQENDSTSHC